MSLTVITRVCMLCKSSFKWTVEMRRVDAWLKGASIDDAFPDIPPSDRKTIETQVCGACRKVVTP